MPAPLPVGSAGGAGPRLDLNALNPLLSDADQAIGRLDGVADLVPNPDLFVAMYVRKEAVLSSQIEGTQASLDDVLEYEAGVDAADGAADVGDVFNYVEALNRALRRLPELPLSLRLLREAHETLLRDGRGSEKSPGEFRTTQNWIGPPGCALDGAVFIPPPPNAIQDHLANLERYLRAEDGMPVLVRCGVAHAQFETIHPFLDGNGRLGRLLISLMLSERRVLSRPLLYLSAYLTAHKAEYYDWLMRVREKGDWEGWLRFYLTGVRDVATDAVTRARVLLALQEKHRALVQREVPSKPNAVRLLDLLQSRPILNVKVARRQLGVSTATANALIADLERLGLLREITGRERDRVFRYQEYLDALSK